MLNLHTVFTADKDLLIGSKSPETEVRLVGEERDGYLLYVWNDSTEEFSHPVTHIGLFDWATKHNEILHVFNKKLNIIQASVSQDGDLLAFVIKEEATGHQGTSCHYEAFVIPVKAKNDFLYNLNVRRQTLIKVQFRYKKGNQKPSSESTIKKKLNNQLIVFIHKEVIEVRHILQNLESKEIVEVETLETIVKTFLWSQWSPLEQCLYYLHYRCSLKAPEEETSTRKPVLTCIQFHDIVHYETVLNIPLDLPNLTPDTCSQIGKYEDEPLSQKVADHHVKLELLTQLSGVVCICYQYQFECLYTQNPEDDSAGVVNFAYSVFLLHQDCSLQCVIPGVPVALANSIKILFTFFEDNHILAIAPGIFTHLLDVGLQHEPCNHILAQDFIQWTRNLTTWKCCRFSVGSSVIWLSSENRGVHVEVNPDGLLEQFLHTQHSSTRRAIVHYLIAHVHADHSLLEKLLVTLLQNALGIEVPKILQELLIGGAFMWIQTQVKPEFLKLLPFTFSESLEPQLEQGYNSSDQLQITYTPLSNISTMLLSPSQRLRPTEVNQWTNLWRLLDIASSRPVTRFSAKGLRHRFVSMDFLQRSESPLPSPPGSDCSVSPNPRKEVIIEESDLNTVINKALRNPTSLPVDESSSVEDLDGMKLIFPEKDSFTHNSQFEQVVSLTLQELSAHILKYFRNEPLNYIHQVSTEYIASQLYMSRLLCHLLISSLVPTFKKEKSDDSVQQPYSFLSTLTPEKEKSLFYLMECYHLAVEEIAFPLPQGFTSFIGILGFRCLDFKMFLQYIQRGSLLLKSEVVKYIMEELNDTEENASIKLEVILRLPKNKSKIFLETWNHPYGESIRAREQCKVLLEIQDDQKQGFELLPVINPMEELYIDKDCDGEGRGMDHPSVFPPSYCFLKLLEFKEAETQQNNRMQVDLDLIKRMSFPYSLKQATCCPTTSCTETKSSNL